MVERVVESISRYTMFEPGQRVGVAVSGGADSVCLLHVLKELAPCFDLQLSVLHLDHQLRGADSRKDAEFTRDLASCLGLPFHLRELDVGRLADEAGENLEQAARIARRDFFLSFLRSGALDRVALGHTRSDQAETVLFRFLRGSGTAGISGIWPRTDEGFVRPLLNIERKDVLRYLRDRGIPWREDGSNASHRFSRNRIRHSLLPGLSREWNPALQETLAQMAVQAQDEEEYWKDQISLLAKTHLKLDPPAVYLRTDGLRQLPRAAARRLIRRAIECAKGDLRRIDFKHVEQVLLLSGRLQGRGRLQIPGLDVCRSFELLRLLSLPLAQHEQVSYRFPLSVPGRFSLPSTRSEIFLERLEVPHSPFPPELASDIRYNAGDGVLDWDRVSEPLELRNWRPGDKYRPVGHTGEVKVRYLFQKARVPLWERETWPVVTSGHSIIWTRQFGASGPCAATASSRAILKVREIKELS